MGRWVVCLCLTPFALFLHLVSKPVSLPRRAAWWLLVAALGDPDEVRAKLKRESEAAAVRASHSTGSGSGEDENCTILIGSGSGDEQRGKGSVNEEDAPEPSTTATPSSNHSATANATSSPTSSSLRGGLLEELWSPSGPLHRLRPQFHRSHGYDLLRVVLFGGALLGLQLLDMSRVYHYIRGQAMIKLYVIISMVEIFDRLISSFGQDVLDSLYWTVRTETTVGGWLLWYAGFFKRTWGH